MCSERHDRVAQRNAARRRRRRRQREGDRRPRRQLRGRRHQHLLHLGRSHQDALRPRQPAPHCAHCRHELGAAGGGCGVGVGRIVGGLHAQVASLQREVARLRGQAAAGQSAVCPSPLATPAEPAPPGKPQGAAPSPHRDSAASPAAAVGAAAVGAAFAAAASATPVPPQQPKPNAFTGLLQPSASATPAYSISGKKAADFYLETQGRGGAICPPCSKGSSRSQRLSCASGGSTRSRYPMRTLTPAVRARPRSAAPAQAR